MNEQKMGDLLPDIVRTLHGEPMDWLLRQLFVRALAKELPAPTSNVEQGELWQAWRAQAGLPPDDGRHDAEPWHTARFGPRATAVTNQTGGPNE